MAEWFKAAVLKTVVRKRTGGSNPPCSEVTWFQVLTSWIRERKQFRYFFRRSLTLVQWSGDREAEGGSLLRSYTPKGYRGFESPLLREVGVFVRILSLRISLGFELKTTPSKCEEKQAGCLRQWFEAGWRS